MPGEGKQAGENTLDQVPTQVREGISVSGHAPGPEVPAGVSRAKPSQICMFYETENTQLQTPDWEPRLEQSSSGKVHAFSYPLYKVLPENPATYKSFWV